MFVHCAAERRKHKYVILCIMQFDRACLARIQIIR